MRFYENLIHAPVRKRWREICLVEFEFTPTKWQINWSVDMSYILLCWQRSHNTYSFSTSRSTPHGDEQRRRWHWTTLISESVRQHWRLERWCSHRTRLRRARVQRVARNHVANHITRTAQFSWHLVICFSTLTATHPGSSMLRRIRRVSMSRNVTTAEFHEPTQTTRSESFAAFRLFTTDRKLG